MKIQLIFPPLVLEHRYAHDVGDVGGNLPPLGLLYIAAVLEKDGHDVRIIDAPVENLDLEDVLNRIGEFRPDFVGISAITSLAKKDWGSFESDSTKVSGNQDICRRATSNNTSKRGSGTDGSGRGDRR